jgi:hypothetical protein
MKILHAGGENSKGQSCYSAIVCTLVVRTAKVSHFIILPTVYFTVVIVKQMKILHAGDENSKGPSCYYSAHNLQLLL